jgi:hypothetical protein
MSRRARSKNGIHQIPCCRSGAGWQSDFTRPADRRRTCSPFVPSPELSRLPVLRSVRTMRRPPPGPISAPSAVSKRPWLSNALPLALPLFSRNTLTCPCGDMRYIRLPARSLKNTSPSAFMAGPSNTVKPSGARRAPGARIAPMANTRTQFDANLLQPDAALDEYRDVRAAVGRRMTQMIDDADDPGVVAATVLRAAVATQPKLRYAAGTRASRLQFLRTFAPVGMVDAAIQQMQPETPPSLACLLSVVEMLGSAKVVEYGESSSVRKRPGWERCAGDVHRAELRNGAVNERCMVGAQLRITESQSFHDAGSVVLDQHTAAHDDALWRSEHSTRVSGRAPRISYPRSRWNITQCCARVQFQRESPRGTPRLVKSASWPKAQQAQSNRTARLRSPLAFSSTDQGCLTWAATMLLLSIPQIGHGLRLKSELTSRAINAR